MIQKHSKTKKSFYRRLLVAYLIDTGINTVPLLIGATSMPKRTIQDTITALSELDIECVFSGATKNGHYSINGWGAINKKYIKDNLNTVNYVLELVLVSE